MTTASGNGVRIGRIGAIIGRLAGWSAGQMPLGRNGRWQRRWGRASRRLLVGPMLVLVLGFALLGWAVWDDLRLLQTLSPGARSPQSSLTDAASGPALAARQRAERRLHTALLLALVVVAAAVALVFWSARVARIVRTRQLRAAASARRRLRAPRRKLAAVLDLITEGIILTDSGGRIELFNPAAEVIFGQLGEDVHGTHLAELLPALLETIILPDADPAETDPHGAASATGAERSAEPHLPAPRGGGERPLPCMHELQARRAGTDQTFPVRVWLRRLPLDDGLRLLLVVEDLTETTLSAQRMNFLEQHDVLTGLLNRKEFERRMHYLLAEAVGSGIMHVLCHIDIDQFKVVNDTAGHAAGDALAKQLAALIGAKLDRAALIGRLGGDEFGVLLVDCSEAQALELCDGLMHTVRNFLFTWRDRSFDIAISIGLTAFLPDNDSTAAELAKADVACHMAKHDGRDRIHVYRDGDASVIRHHGDMHLVSTITDALNSGRFRLYAQAIVPLAVEASDAPSHFEILVRMLDEQGQSMVPTRFIPAAEQYILMPAVDRWIIAQLFSSQAALLQAWHARHPGHFLFAINLSGTSVADESLLPYLRRQFDLYGIPPQTICFEITETAAMRDLADARAFMMELVKMGCCFALDDFGSGMSSYNYLRELPVSYLKIDGSFVHDMHVNPINHALVASINQIAHVLGLKTIAEWAEETATVNALRALDVDFVQGYAVGSPRPVGELTLAGTFVRH